MLQNIIMYILFATCIYPRYMLLGNIYALAYLHVVQLRIHGANSDPQPRLGQCFSLITN
jgi:hypothetical protein